MKIIKSTKIIKSVQDLCIQACCVLPVDVVKSYEKAKNIEINSIAIEVLDQLIDNASLGKKEMIPVCQDTGMVIVFVTMGNQVQIQGMSITDAINHGVAKGYEKGFLRKSVVKDPLIRENTNDNTPAIIYYNMVLGDVLTIDVLPKGFGSENMSAIKMLKPTEGIQAVKDFLINTVKMAGPNACPPFFIGIGLGGTMDKAAVLSKKALLRKANSIHENKFYQKLESDLLEEVNKISFGPAGFKGKTTAFNVFIEAYPTHIAGFPMAITIGCHSYRHKGITL
ncbi:MAG: fumarate hydratase [Clostridiales bacterium]|nr:fumarate hydratase [Clostridiales bacterium]